MTKRWLIDIHGKVQGVYYRKSTAEKARELGLVGWVKNESDGSVKCEAEGTVEQLQALAQWMEQGPPLAVVLRVDIREIDVFASEYAFDVRY